MSSDTLHDPLLGVTPVRRRASHAAAGGGGGQRALGSSMRRAYRKIRKASARSTFNRLKLFRLRTSVKLRVVDMSELGLWWALGWRSALREVSELLPWIVTLSVVGRLKSGEPTEDGKHSEPAELAAMALTEIWGCVSQQTCCSARLSLRPAPGCPPPFSPSSLAATSLWTCPGRRAAPPRPCW